MQENISLIIYIHMITLLFDVYGQSNFKNVFWKKKNFGERLKHGYREENKSQRKPGNSTKFFYC